MIEGLGGSDQFPGPLKPLQNFEFIVLTQIIGSLFRVLEELFDSVGLGPDIDNLEQLLSALLEI